VGAAKPLILQSEYARWREALPEDYPTVADYLYGVSSVRFHMAGRQMMFGDGEARLIERGLFRQLEWLQIKRGRGDFGPSNAEYVHNVNDAKNVAFTYWLHQAHGSAPPATQAQLDKANTRVLHSPHSRFVCVRDPARFASASRRSRRVTTSRGRTSSTQPSSS